MTLREKLAAREGYRQSECWGGEPQLSMNRNVHPRRTSSRPGADAVETVAERPHGHVKVSDPAESGLRSGRSVRRGEEWKAHGLRQPGTSLLRLR
jgi:hypothetical protein